MKKIRVGIIGQGRSGRDIHDHSFRDIVPDKYQVVAVADPIEERCRRATAEFGYATYTDYREMLKRDDLDLIVNASPSHLHVPVTMEVLDAGFNVLTEKPLARKAADVDMLIQKAEATGKLFAVFQQSRFAPYYLQVNKVIDSGLIGRIVMIKMAFNGFARRWDWQTLQEMDGGNLLNTGPHPLDQALHFIGRDAMPQVLCLMDRTDNTFGNAEDHVKLIMHRQGKPIVDLEISSCCAYPLYTYQVYGTHGGLTGNMTHIDWKYFNPEEAPQQALSGEPLPGPSYCSEQLTWHEENWDLPADEADLFNTMGKRFYDNLYDALINGAPLEVAPCQVRQQVAVIEECHRQNRLA
ncbi:MAG: Gfo/Idh/MocA family oxidoreductase [bacterium]|nr:Gfo/Idh/MocA family oxidoreductase [bacterium]